MRLDGHARVHVLKGEGKGEGGGRGNLEAVKQTRVLATSPANARLDGAAAQAQQVLVVVNQPTNQPTNQPINQPTNQPTD